MTDLEADRPPPGERERWLADFADAEGFQPILRQPSPRNPGQKKSAVKVKSLKVGDETLVLCHSQARIAKDRAIREKQEARLVKDLDRLGRRIAQGKLVTPPASGELDKVFDIQKNGGSIGGVTFASLSNTGTFTFSGATSFAAGDRLAIITPANPSLSEEETAIANIAITFKVSA